MLDFLPRLLWVLCSLVVALPIVPIKWSVCAYLTVVHLDLSGAGFASASSFGMENAIKIVGLPTILLIRTRFGGIELLKNNRVFHLWILFGLYVAVASLWTSHQLSAIKQLGYLYTYTATLLVFVRCYSEDKAGTYQSVSWSVIFALILAVIQTFFVEEFGHEEDRFTSFTGQQGFGLYLVLIFAIILSFARQRVRGTLPRGLLVFLLLIALYLNGSRTGFISMLIVSISTALFWSASERIFSRVVLLFGTACIVIAMTLTVIFFLPVSVFSNMVQSQRALQVLGAVGREYSLHDIGTFRFRLTMYQTVLNRISKQSLQETVFGRGTSSAAEIITLGDYRYSRGRVNQLTVDGNRVIHNEFLRTFYEWGSVGSALFILMLIYLFAGVLRTPKQNHSFEGYVLGSTLFGILLFLTVVNVFATSGTPLGTGITLVLAQLVSLDRTPLTQRSPGRRFQR